MSEDRLQKFNSHLGWAVDRRSLAQKLMHDLFDHMDTRPAPGFQFQDNARWKPMARLIDATFSLWRSAFLTKVTRSREDIFKQTKSYLKKVLEQNTVTFADDFANSELTVGYYMSNARYRIERMYEKDPALLQIPAVQKIYKMRDTDIESHNQQDLWDAFYCALADCAEAYGFCPQKLPQPKKTPPKRRGKATKARA